MDAIGRSPVRPRVLTVARWYPSHDSPGRGSFVADLVAATARAGIEARVVSFDRILIRGRLEERDEVLADARAAYERVATPGALFATPASWGIPGVPVARVPVVRRPGSGDPTALVDDHLAALRPFVSRLVREWRPDVIHAHTGLPDGIVAAELGRELGIPVFVTEHASTIEAELADPMALERYRTLLEPGVQLLAVSPSVAERVAALLGVTADRLEVLPNPVADVAFPLADPAGRDPNELLWVGSLGAHKGIELLLVAFAALRGSRPGLRLRLIGRERAVGDRALWQALAKELDIEEAVDFEGWLDRRGVAAAMARAAVFVHPSPSETFGVAAAEAILTGLPVAARRSGGVPWIIRLSGGYGSVADGNDADTFASAIEAVLTGAVHVDAAAARDRLVSVVGEAAVAGQALALYGRAMAGTAAGVAPGAGVAGTAAGAAPLAGDSAGPVAPAPVPPVAPAPVAPVGPVVLPGILVATGRDHALPLIAGLPAGLRDGLVLVVPAWQEGATEARKTEWPVRLLEAAPVPPPKARPRGRGPLARLKRALYRPAATADQLLASAVLAAAVESRTNDQPVEMIAIDAPAAALIGRLAGSGIRLAPGGLRWLADRWDAEAGTGASTRADAGEDAGEGTGASTGA